MNIKLKQIATIQSSVLAALLLAVALIASGCDESPSSTEATDPEAALMAGFIGIEHTHDNPDETCFICDAEKRDEGRLWCKEHGRYEDRCWLCHPELEDKDRLYCREHGLYEDECFLCHPEVKGDDEAPAAASGGGQPEARTGNVGLFCHEHGVPERECGICQPDLAKGLEPGENLKVRFPSGTVADKIGIETQYPEVSRIAPSISAYCETQYNLNALTKVTPLVDGVIRSVHSDLGNKVSKGDPLLDIHSAAVAEAKSSYLSALVRSDIARQTLDRVSRLQEQNIAAEKELIKAEADFRSASLSASNLRQRLLNLGMSTAEIDTVEQEQDTSALLTIRAPFTGTLVARDAVVGEAVKVGDELFTVADLTKYWLKLSIPSDSVGKVTAGQVVKARFAELPNQEVEGRITWVDTSIDHKSRMVRARAVVEPEGVSLPAGLYGDARIVVGEDQPGSLLPQSAVQRHEGADFVFVRDSKDLFALRRVSLGSLQGDRVQVLAGVSPGDHVVTKGSFIAMSEFLKSRLGAGCTH